MLLRIIGLTIISHPFERYCSETYCTSRGRASESIAGETAREADT
jgi:hypothetical protein